MRQGKVLLADNHQNMLAGVRTLMESMFDNVFMVSDEASLMEAAEKLVPNLIVADLSLPVTREVNIVRHLKKAFPEIKVIILSVHDESTAVNECIEAGASELRTAVEGFQVTAQGLRKLGSGTVSSESGKSPGGAVGLATLLATHNPAGLIVSTGAHLYGEKSGRSTVEGRAKQTAKEIGDVLKKRFQQEGWIN